MEAVSGWRLKGCGELKRGLKNYQQGRPACYPPPSARRLALAEQRAETRQRKARDKNEEKKQREREKEGDKVIERRRGAEDETVTWRGSVKSEPAVSRHIFFRLKQFFCSFLTVHPYPAPRTHKSSLASSPFSSLHLSFSLSRPLLFPANGYTRRVVVSR